MEIYCKKVVAFIMNPYKDIREEENFAITIVIINYYIIHIYFI